jgi:DNA end-binding protein Ku
VPEPPGKKPHTLLVEGLRQKGRVAIARLTRSQREITVILRPVRNGLVAHCMYFSNEVRQVAEFEAIERAAVSPAELALAGQLVESLAAPWKPEQYQDGYQARLGQLLTAKQKGETVTATPEPERIPVADMMAALEASLAALPRKKVAA